MIGQEVAARTDLHTMLDQAVRSAYAVEERAIAKRELYDMIERIERTEPDLFFADYFLLPIAFIMSRVGVNSAMLNVTLFESPITFDPMVDPRIDIPSIIKMPVVHLCSREFDLPQSEPKGYPCYYIEPAVDLSRRESVFPWHRLKEGAPLLYCSFGSQNRVYLKAQKAIRTVIDAMSAKPDRQMVIALGPSLNHASFGATPPNVLLANVVPQLEVLKRASAMITHGGINSVRECIFSGVPMIVIPIDLDQPLNALRVVRHGIGLMESPGNLSVDRLCAMIETLENDPSYKSRVEAMRARFMESANSTAGAEIITTLLSRPSRSRKPL
jgi:UDP:flavonoid glycosyltransferase YjiC (YdhE family)